MNWIRESNLIEGVDDPKEDARSLRAWKWFLEQETISLLSILVLHKKITYKELGWQAGKWRACDVTVGGRICPHWTHVPPMMKAWRHDWNVADPIGPLKEWVKKAHISFERIHPFVDGNGRTGRMIMNWQRVKWDVGDPLCIEAAKRQDYYEWFRE